MISAGSDSGQKEITPGRRFRCAKRHGHIKVRQVLCVRHDPEVHGGDQHSTERSKQLCDAEPFFTLGFVRKDFCDPRDGRDKLNADADERAAPPKDERFERLTKRSCDGRERVDQDSQRHHELASETIDKPSSQEAKHAAAKGAIPEQFAHPVWTPPDCSAEPEQLRDRRRSDQRRHQQLVGIEKKADTCDDDDQPLGEIHGAD